MSLRRLASEKSGQTLVEFTLVCLLLVGLLFAIIQYGFLFAAYITVRNASAVGARQAILPGGNTNASNVAKAALAPMLNPNLAPAPTVVQTNVGGTTAWSVTVSYPVPLIIPFVVPGGGSTKTLTATTVMK